MKNMYSVMSLASLTRNFLSLMTCIDEQVFWNKNTLFLTELKFVEFFRADISKKSLVFSSLLCEQRGLIKSVDSSPS